MSLWGHWVQLFSHGCFQSGCPCSNSDCSVLACCLTMSFASPHAQIGKIWNSLGKLWEMCPHFVTSVVDWIIEINPSIVLNHSRVRNNHVCKCKINVTGCGHISYSLPGKSWILPITLRMKTRKLLKISLSFVRYVKDLKVLVVALCRRKTRLQCFAYQFWQLPP